MYWLGVISRDGLTGDPDYQEALTWFGQARKAGSESDAAAAIQGMIDSGYVTSEDAAEWLK